MITISGYQITETLYESSRTLVYRGLRNLDQTPVVLKMLRQEYAAPKALAKSLARRFAQFQMEYNIIRSLNLNGVIKTYGLETYQQSPVIVLEDFGGESLSQLVQNRLLNLEEFLPLALQITQTLGEIHQRNITHKDINPSNIVLNSKTGQVKIIDFGIATALAQENPTLRNPNVLEGTLAYMSPEQTGRMNRDIDYRTDFYSLGVTFYQLLCDRLPFETTDVMELVHHHIARQPTPPHHLNPDIPPSLSHLVMKLLAKTAEDRYQSARGICADLQQCLDQLQQKQPFVSFSLGCHDLSDKFQIPQKLYGREREVADLLAAFERVLGRGEWGLESREVETQNSELKTQNSEFPHLPHSTLSHSELVLISGPPGIGKTTLVRELYKPMTQRRGYFIAGKFDPLQRNVPYACLIQAFQELIRQLLTEAEDQIDHWREKLQMALGSSGQVIVDVIPEVQLIVGKQPDLIQLPPAESENRFNWMFQNFIRVFTQAEHPLVIFLDDLQWADTASLQFIQRLMTMPDNQYLLIIGTLRDNEVDLAHPLMRTLDEIRRAEGAIEQIILPPLSLEDIHRLIQDTLHCESERSRPLAELVLRKTDGNPFFINEFLKFLHQNQLIRFDFHTGRWQWSLTQIQQVQSTDNVIALVIDKVQRLSAANRHILQLAACIGHQFDLQTLATISEKPLPVVAAELWAAMQEGLVFPIGDDYKYLPFEQATNHRQPVAEKTQDSSTTEYLTADIFYKFTHDRIQQAVYSLISEADKKHCHGKIGRLLLAVIPPEQLEEQIFEVIDHLNIGVEMMAEEAKTELARLNLIAGQKAKASVAYESALSYLSMGLSLLQGDRWQRNYGLTLALTELAAELSYLTGDFEQMERLADQVLCHAQTVLDRTNAYLVKIQACIAQNWLLDAIRTALQALELLGVRLPEKPSRLEVLQGLIKTKWALAGKRVEDLVNLPRMTDPYKLAVMQVIASVCTPTYFLVPELWQLMVFQKIQLSVKYGNAPGSAFGYADYGMILCGVEQNIKAGYRFSQLASTLQSQLNAKAFIPKTSLLINMYLKHWQEHLRETVNPLLEAYQCGLETGDLEYGTFAIAYRFYHSYLLGRELSQLDQEMISYEGAIAQFKQVLPLNLTRIYHQAILNLMGQSEDPCRLVGKSYNEDESLPQHLAANDRYTVFNLYLNKLILGYLFQNITQAAEYAQKTEQLLSEGAVGLLVVPVFYFYHSLAQIAVFPETSQTQQVRILRSVTANQKKIKRWAEQAPMNYLHKFYLVEAERHRILGQDAEAGENYDRAIAIAKEQEYLNEEALAHELAGRFYLAKGKTLIAQAYLQAAHYGYLKWGATAKVRQLEHRYPQFFGGLSRQSSSVSLSRSLTSSPTTTSRTGAEILDLATIMKASQALSDEIVLDKLLAKLMTILIENAGANRGCLLLETQGKWQVRAEGNVNPGSVTVYQAINEESSPNVATAIVNYVARTQESVVLNHATQETRFSQDVYIQQHQPKSILCTPLVYQGKLSGVLYLENNLAIDAFTAERLETLQMLSSQAAISIDNARLYSELELRVQERTTELVQMNERLKQLTTELQRSNQDLEQFAYIASHDLQEPLRAIISYTQMLAKKYQGKLDEKADLYIHFAVDGAIRMQQLIRDLLAYSRAGRQNLKRQSTDCNLLIQKVLQDLQVAIAESNTTITTDPLPTLNADSNQLFLLFQNLIGNAIKYRGEEPPQIHISAVRNQELEDQEESDTWLFSIRDNGIGIEPQYCDRIFGIFQRLHTQEEYSGTGLGLAISKKIVERHGGRIWVESQTGQGSTFYIEIPNREN